MIWNPSFHERVNKQQAFQMCYRDDLGHTRCLSWFQQSGYRSTHVRNARSHTCDPLNKVCVRTMLIPSQRRI